MCCVLAADCFDPSLRRALDDQRADHARLVLASFTLENGGEQLAPWFDDVRLLRPEPSVLRVTESRALIDYLLSTPAWQALLAGDVLDSFRRFLDAEIVRDGAIVLTKEAGMFEARKA